MHAQNPSRLVSATSATHGLWDALALALGSFDRDASIVLPGRLASSPYIHPIFRTYPRTLLPAMISTATYGRWSARVAMPDLNIDWIERLIASYGKGRAQEALDLHKRSLPFIVERELSGSVAAPAVVEMIGNYLVATDQELRVPGGAISTIELERSSRDDASL